MTMNLRPLSAEGLQQLSCDLWWSWNPAAREVFRRLDYSLWRHTDHNPVKMLGALPAERLQQAARDSVFRESYEETMEQLAVRVPEQEPGGAHSSGLSDITIAYFSAEFAVHQSVPLYAGGLGVSGGRSLQRGPRSGSSVRRCRFPVFVGIFSTGYFP